MVCEECTRREISLGRQTNVAGAGAERMADSASRRHAERLLAAYPMLGEELLQNATPPASARSWVRGADGERIVGQALDKLAATGRIEVLHDRLIPESRSNIDHIVVSARRITVIDAKHYRGAIIDTKTVNDDRVLTIDGKDASHLVDGVRGQRAKIQAALGADYTAIVDGIIAFVGAKHGKYGTATCRGISCMNVEDAVGRAAFSAWFPGNPNIKLDANKRTELRDQLAGIFPAYRR